MGIWMTTSRELHRTAELVLGLPSLVRDERTRRGLSLRATANESGVGIRVIDSTCKGHLPTAHHAAELLDWLGRSQSK